VITITTPRAPAGDRSSRTASERNEEQQHHLPGVRRHSRHQEITLVRALKSNGLWLTVGYVGLLLLMARAYS
jgi:hypothetical protein